MAKACTLCVRDFSYVNAIGSIFIISYISAVLGYIAPVGTGPTPVPRAVGSVVGVETMVFLQLFLSIEGLWVRHGVAGLVTDGTTMVGGPPVGDGPIFTGEGMMVDGTMERVGLTTGRVPVVPGGVLGGAAATFVVSAGGLRLRYLKSQVVVFSLFLRGVSLYYNYSYPSSVSVLSFSVNSSTSSSSILVSNFAVSW